jgi:hypothetical protein
MALLSSFGFFLHNVRFVGVSVFETPLFFITLASPWLRPNPDR